MSSSSSFWAAERAAHHGTPADELAHAYDNVSAAPYDFACVAPDAHDVKAEVVNFVVRRVPRGESLRALFTYLIQVHDAHVYTLRAPAENNTLVAAVVGVGVPLRLPGTPTSIAVGKVLLSTMLAVRALDCHTGLAERFLRLAFADTAARGYSVRVFAGDKPLQAARLHPAPVERRIFDVRTASKAKVDPQTVSIGRVNRANISDWLGYFARYSEHTTGGIDWVALAQDADRATSLLCHRSLFTAVAHSDVARSTSLMCADHAAVFLHAGPDHVHMLYHATWLGSDQRLLRFLRGVSAATGKAVIVDCCTRVLATSSALREESQPSAALPHGYTWFAHNLAADICNGGSGDTSDVFPGLPML